MDKIARKKLELELILSAEEILRRHNEVAVAKIPKVLKESARQVTKKFAKAVKSVEKKSAKLKPAPKAKPAAKRGRPPAQAKKKK
jgi:hypothetical protein